jgi:hypothetical protein
MENVFLHLEAGIAAGAAPDGVPPHDLRRALEAWQAWCVREGRDPGWLSAESGAAYLDALIDEAATLRSGYARFSIFQISAGLGWGPETSAHLARTLRASRVTKKNKPADRWTRAAGAVAKLPAAWKPSFEALLAVSRDAPRSRATLIWSAARIEAVASALRRFSGFAAKKNLKPVPTASLFQSWAEHVVENGAAAITAAAYCSRVIDGFERVLTPGTVYDAAAAVADRWAVRADDEPQRKGKASRIVPASEIDALGFKLMAQAEAAPLRRISEATLYRDGLLLAVAATLPERARALSALEFDVTVFLEGDGVIRFAIPGEHLKLAERRKARRGFHARIRRPSLHRALARWRDVYRPMFDDGLGLWPSRHDMEHGLTEGSLGMLGSKITKARLGRSISLHLIRDCVATEIVESDPIGGPVRAQGVLRHKDPRITSDFYIHADGLVVSTGWQAAVSRQVGPDRENLAIW